MLATRTYSVKVEMHRQLGLDSRLRPCGADAETWAVFYSEKQCVEAVACTASELDAVFAGEKTAEQTCVAAGVNDVEQTIDHKYPQSLSVGKTAILYGLMGMPGFYDFHNVLKARAESNEVQYILRHFAKNSTLETLLQGYGVALDIKNMEYKTIDDSKKNDGDDDAVDTVDDDEDGDGEDGEEEDVEGFLFNVLVQRHGAIATELKEFRDSLVKQDDQAQEVKAWHLKDLGLAAARDILDAKHPLKRLQALSQDFPKHAKKLAFSRKPLTDEFREEIERRQMEAVQNGLVNKFLLNGISIDPTQRSFNIYDFMNTLKEEWSVAKKLVALPLNDSELNTMLAHVRESNQAQKAVRIRVRGTYEGTAPFYLNNIETDSKTAQWPLDIDQLRRPAWNIIFVRKNMYEYVVVFDPMTSNGRTILNQIAFMRMRGAPLQWGLLISSKELMEAKVGKERDALIQRWKFFKVDDRANAWHFAKLLFLARAKDAEVAAKEEDPRKQSSNRIVSAFIEGVADEGTTEVTIQHLVTSYVDSAFGLMSRAKLEEEALYVLRSDEKNDLVLSMTEYIQKKHLPLESSLFNGVLRKNTDVQSEIMSHLGRDQGVYQAMARNDQLEQDTDFIEELLSTQETYPAYFPIFDTSKNAEDGSKSPQNLLSHDADHKIENLLEAHVGHFHALDSLLIPKKQTLLFVVNLGYQAHAGHVYRGVKAVLEDSEKTLRVGVVPRLDATDGQETSAFVASIIAAVGTSDEESHLRFVMEALNCVMKGKSLESSKTKLTGILNKLEKEDGFKDKKMLSTLKTIVSGGENLLSDAKKAGFKQLSSLLMGASTRDQLARLYINGFPIDLPAHSISDEDMAALTEFDSKYRSHAVGKAFVKKSAKLTMDEANKISLDIVKVCDLVDKYKKAERAGSLDLEDSQLVVRLPGDPALTVSAYLDPLSEASQMISSLLLMLHTQLNATIELVLLPSADYAQFPLQRFYRYLFGKTPSLATPSVEFRKLPIKPILTMKIETPEAWNVQIHETKEDLDNLRVDPDSAVDVKATKTAVFKLESLLVYGQCRDKTFEMYTPPHGLQLVLERDVGTQRLHRDTLVMRNFGYFQLQATPGVWSLHLARGRATELFEIVDMASDQAVDTTPVQVYDFGSRLSQLIVRKRKGREHDALLDPEAIKKASKRDVEPIAEDAGILGSYWGSMMSLLGKKSTKETVEVNASNAGESAIVAHSNVNKGRTGETIHVFSLATGHLYERFLKIMMSSVLKRTKNPVTFWLLENFLSPDFKQSIPALRETFGMDIRLVTYKWPNWLRQQTQKQRIIWGYKILFLDVLFPLGVQKIIYVDADQVVRADLKELWEMDLQGAPYGYTPFCDSRNVGFQFWRQGYWKDHLRGRPYHISALYVVDLALFRQMAAGDALRATYEQLSADPNSLSNLDQDLPNYMQHQIKIFSLPQEWLWCDSWCSDESKVQAKTIDLCNNPKHKEPKLDMAKRVISGELFNESWIELDQEIKDAEAKFFKDSAATPSE
uniref:UDP-glucose:glycoprotein glucosyltransferase n=1 Tax=Globisporangium ultimum (strain ATCC 200006 / CBS 805.95 / DAOM BR144) TaxID=431595 RepID=K3X2B8_GLOUD